jgi:hypothetical protein
MTDDGQADLRAEPPDRGKPLRGEAAGSWFTTPGRGVVLSRGLRWFFAIAALLVGAVALYFVLSSTGLLRVAVTTGGSERVEEGGGPPSSRELSAAMGQHFFMALPISKCFDADITKTNVSSTVIATLMLGLQPLGNHEWRSRGSFDKSDPEPSLKLTSFQTTVLVLSDAITRARMRFADSADVNKTRMESYQWVLVILGALTTIFISLKSILTDRAPGFILIGILAVIFSALSTACSSMIAFYTPNDSYVRSDRALTQLRQLHNDLGFFVANIPDICIGSLPDSDDAKRSLKDLSTRLTEIVNVSGGSGQGQNSGGSAGQTGPGK